MGGYPQPPIPPTVLIHRLSTACLCISIVIHRECSTWNILGRVIHSPVYKVVDKMFHVEHFHIVIHRREERGASYPQASMGYPHPTLGGYTERLCDICVTKCNTPLTNGKSLQSPLDCLRIDAGGSRGCVVDSERLIDPERSECPRNGAMRLGGQGFGG